MLGTDLPPDARPTLHVGNASRFRARGVHTAAAANRNAHATFLDIFQGIASQDETVGVTAALAIETQQAASDWCAPG
jgi:hypothetical protein